MEEDLLGVRVLVVSSHDVARYRIGQYLEESGCEVMRVPDARTAIFELGRGDYDAVVTEYTLADKNGVNLIADMRELGLRTPVVLLATHHITFGARLRGNALALNTVGLKHPDMMIPLAVETLLELSPTPVAA